MLKLNRYKNELQECISISIYRCDFKIYESVNIAQLSIISKVKISCCFQNDCVWNITINQIFERRYTTITFSGLYYF